jgi:hypothetical protein
MPETEKAIAAWHELEKEQRLLRVALLEQSDAEGRLQTAESGREWAETAVEYAETNARVIRARARIRILTGRIHFYSQTVTSSS